MLTIRTAQMNAFKMATRNIFVEQMVLHLKQAFPVQCQFKNDAQLKEIVSFGIESAENYGFQCKDDVRNYLNLMFTFGKNFDTDIDTSWAHYSLRRQESPEQRMAHIYLAAKGRVGKGLGI